MDIFWTMGLKLTIVGGFIFISLILSWINYSQIKKIKRQLQQKPETPLEKNIPPPLT